jgi:hypothetical protein
MTTLIRVALLLSVGASQAASQDSASRRDSLRVRRGSEFLIPLASLVLPGTGQYIHGAPAKGAVYTSVAVAGVAVYLNGPAEDALFPRSADGQRGAVGLHFYSSTTWLSAWDAFHRAMPAMQQQGKYKFLPAKRERISQLMLAPLDYRFLGRWTTWVDLAQTALVSGALLTLRDSAVPQYPYLGRDAAFAVSLSASAGVGEEAFFRGYFLPVLYQKTGKFWVANATQAAVFGVGHGPAGLVFQAPWGLWEGWITRRNDWSIRESVFHHFWYDVAVSTAGAIAEERPVMVRLRFPAITF